MLQGISLAAAMPGAAFGEAQQGLWGQICEDAARAAKRAFVPLRDSHSARLSTLDYDAQRQIRFKPEQALWHGEGLPFEVQLFHRAGGAANPVRLYQVEG